MAGTKARIEFYSDDKLLASLEKAGGNAEKAVIEALKASSKLIKKDMMSYIKKHRQTGATEDSYSEEIYGRKGKIYMKVGFDIKKGGLPALFLNYGTPRIAPSFFIDNAIDHNVDAVREAQIDAILKAFEEAVLGVG